MNFYVGIDLHSNNNYLVIMDEEETIHFEKRLPNDVVAILQALQPFQSQITDIAVESTYNWYWLVDSLMEAGYHVRLANTAAIQQYSGLKHTNDRTDARWLAKLLKLKLLPEGYIYPKEQRGLRELLRKRCWLVEKQTAHLLSIQAIITRYKGIRLNASKIKQLQWEELITYLSDSQVCLAAYSQLSVLKKLIEEIDAIEQQILSHLKENETFDYLKSMPGIGAIIAMVILLETGSIQRFAAAGHYASYCRCVESKKISNAKKKGENNRKNGNHYLAWAFMEAANNAIRHYPAIKNYYQRKAAKSHRVVALKAVAHKLARASFYIQRDQVEFNMQKAFGGS